MRGCQRKTPSRFCRIADCRADQRDRPLQHSAVIFSVRVYARRGPRERGRPGLFRNDGDGPGCRGARLDFHDRTNVAGDCGSGGTHGGGPAIELGDPETPHFLLIARFKREHERTPFVHATIVRQRYPSVKIPDRRSTADACSGAARTWRKPCDGSMQAKSAARRDPLE
jgi:hypothetical protein